MTQAHDDRSPYRNQRWVECVGDSLDFGDCVEIVDSTRVPEPDGIRTIFQGTTPTLDSVANTVIVGQMAGKKAYCTNDFPTYAKVSGNVSVGDEVGPVAGSRILSKGRTGYLVMGDIQGGMARVRRKESGLIGSIAYTQTTDRTRTTTGGKSIGYAQATIDSHVGDIGPYQDGDTITLVFTDKRRLEAVKGCQGRADYIAGYFLVTLPQGLVQGFWFTTTEDRSTGAPQQDVKCTVVQNVGHADDDYPRELWGGAPTNQVQCGSTIWQWEVTQQAWLVINLPVNGCCVFANTTPPPPPADRQLSGQTTETFGNFIPGPTCPPPTPANDIKVRYLEGTFPRMKSGALGYASLDNDIENEDDNSTMVWIVEVSDEETEYIEGLYPEDNCGVNFQGSNLSNWGEWPHSQDPDATVQITNSHHNLAGDWFVARWSKSYGQYVVIDSADHMVINRQNFRTEYDEQTECYTEKYDAQEVWVQRCKPPTEVILRSYKKRTVHEITGVDMVPSETGEGSSAECTPLLYIYFNAYETEVTCQTDASDNVNYALDTELLVVDVTLNGNCVQQQKTQVIAFGRCDGYLPYEDVVCAVEYECDPQDQTSINDTDSPYSILVTDGKVYADSTNADVALVVPAAADSEDREITIKKDDTSSNKITMTVSGGGTIDGETEIELTGTLRPSITMTSDGTEWRII